MATSSKDDPPSANHNKKEISGKLILGVDLIVVGVLTFALAMMQILRVAQFSNASSLLALGYVFVTALALGLGTHWTFDELIGHPDVFQKKKPPAGN